MDQKTISLCAPEIPILQHSWRAIPHVGYYFDRVIAISHKPAPLRLALALQALTSIPDLCERKIYDACLNFITSTSGTKSDKATNKSFARYLSGVFGLLSKNMSVDDLVDAITGHYGHVSTIYRRNGVPIAINDGAHIVGFYPSFRAKIKTNGVLDFRDQSLSERDRAHSCARYDRSFPGALGDDEDVQITSCVIIKTGPKQVLLASKALKAAAATSTYHAFSRKGGLNCATHHFSSADTVGSRTPNFLRHALPSHISWSIEHKEACAPGASLNDQDAQGICIPRALMQRAIAAFSHPARQSSEPLRMVADRSQGRSAPQMIFV
jgi:hypothetical protein